MSMSELLRFVTASDAIVEPSSWGPHEWLCRPGLTAAKQLQVVRVSMPPGTGHAFHRHPAMEEIIYVIAGRAEQWVESTSRVLGPGEIAHIPTDVVHGTYNASKGRFSQNDFFNQIIEVQSPRIVRLGIQVNF